MTVTSKTLPYLDCFAVIENPRAAACRYKFRLFLIFTMAASAKLEDKSKKATEKYRLIFDGIDSDGSGTLDREEIQQASKRLGVSFDRVADRMGDDANELSFDQFVEVIEGINRSNRQASALIARKRRDAYIHSTYTQLLGSDGTLFVGSLRKGLAAIGLPLGTDARHALVDRIKPAAAKRRSSFKGKGS